MTEQEQKYLKLAQRARADSNDEDAMKFYDMVRTENPDNVEARFFYPYYRMWSGKKGELLDRFIDLANSLDRTVKALAESKDLSDEEKDRLLSEMFDAVEGLPVAVVNTRKEIWQVSKSQADNELIKKAGRSGIEMMYSFGDSIAEYRSNEVCMKIAVSAWKKAVNLQQQWPYYGVDKSFPDQYLAKIQKYDPSYVLPKKAGCISFG